MSAIQTLFKVRRCGVTLVPSGDRLRFHPASSLAPELVDELREHKSEILEHLARSEERRRDTSPRIDSVGEVLEMAHAYFNLPPDERIEPPIPRAPRGTDPMGQRHGEKFQFFRGDWREADPRDFRVHRPGEGAA